MKGLYSRPVQVMTLKAMKSKKLNPGSNFTLSFEHAMSQLRFSFLSSF